MEECPTGWVMDSSVTRSDGVQREYICYEISIKVHAGTTVDAVPWHQHELPWHHQCHGIINVLPRRHEFFQSKTFQAGPNARLTWKLYASPQTSPGWPELSLPPRCRIGVVLGLIYANPGKQVRVQCSYSTEKSKERIDSVDTTSTFTASGRVFVCSADLNAQSRHYGNINLRCEITAEIQTDTAVEASSIMSRLSDDFDLLLKETQFADIKLVAGDREFPAHKNILAARSPVFRAMFEHDTQESRQGRVEITDVEPDVLQSLLRFIYTGRVDSATVGLFAAADKYQLQQLAQLCAERLEDQLTAANAIDMLILADQHSAQELKTKAVRVVVIEIQQVTEGPAWDRLCADPRLMAWVMKWK